MRLHEDINAFRVLINDIHVRTGHRLDVLEKDYYVVLILEELAKKQEEGLAAYFKGGTALYKALHTINRFSEDIDLSVDTRSCSRTQNDKRLENATKKYSSLKRETGQGFTHRSEVVAIYSYEPITDYDKDDALQRFGKLKIEATSFTISEPVINMEVTALIYELATAEQKKILEEQYDVKPFNVQTIALERIFIDKLFAAEAYVRKAEMKNKAFEAAKHIYDLTIMGKLPQITRLLNTISPLDKLLNIRMQEETGRLDGVPGVLPKEFTFFENIKGNNLIISAYETMQRQYVLRDCDRIPYADAISALTNIRQELARNIAWNSVTIPETELKCNLIAECVDEIVLSMTDIAKYNVPRMGTVIVPSEVEDETGKIHKVTGIGTGAFYNCTDLENVTLPDGISISTGAFMKCCNADIDIPTSTVSIDDHAFDDVAHITYHGNLPGAPWGANSMN